MVEQWNDVENAQLDSNDGAQAARESLSQAAFERPVRAAANAVGAAGASDLPLPGGMDRVQPPRGSDVVEQLDRTAYNRTPAEQQAFEAADRLLPRNGQNSRSFTQAELDALGRDVVRAGMQANPTQFTDYLQRSLRAAGVTNATVSTGTEVQQQRPSHPDSAYHPAPVRTPYVEIRNGNSNIRIRY